MPKNHVRLSLVCLLALWLGLGSAKLNAQPDLPLSADLIFSTAQIKPNEPPQTHNILARLDAATSEVSPFYTDASAVYLKALAWSPDGKLLAFLQVTFDGRNYPTQLCLLDQSGAAQGCFDEAPIGYFSVYNPNTITWSPAGDRLYFVSGDASARRLVEADVATHKTLRTIYEYPVPDNQMTNPPTLAWTDDLAYLTIGAGDPTRVQQGMPVLLVDLSTQKTVDLAHISGATGGSPFVVCPFFSPQGTYLTAHNFDVPETPSQPQFLILNQQGAIVSTITPTEPLNVLPRSCPAWQQDERAFYFPLTQGDAQASNLRILKYSLDTSQFSTVYNSGQLTNLAEATVNSRLALSPDEQFLVFDSPYDPTISDGTQVTVISLGQSTPTLRRYSAPFRFSSDPLWGLALKKSGH